MDALPPLPPDSRIERATIGNRLEFWWRPPRYAWLDQTWICFQYGIFVALVFTFLGFVLVALPQAVAAPLDELPHLCWLIFLGFCLLIWVIPGVPATYLLIALVLSGRIERLTLSNHRLRFVPGPFHPLRASMRKRIIEVKTGELRSIYIRPLDIDRRDVALIEIEFWGRPRLILEQHEQRIEIGAELSDADRAWLFEVLQAWNAEDT